ncbi:MAG: hypothetical protein F9K27_06765 [Anaerolineae bacterium]|nr:MAG: hypothetical protein F9K27_06765 [Anaerolineae bacterium]
MLTDREIETLIQEIRTSKKYRDLDICEDTIRDVLLVELARHKKVKDGVKAARKKLHEVVAPYLGDPDYTQAKADLEMAFQSGAKARIKTVCAAIMESHDTTRERLEIIETFYPRIFSVTGVPEIILDVACGLNPLTMPWIDSQVTFYAYDIHQPRVDFLNHFFALQGGDSRAKIQDILVQPPEETGRIALLLKELHRFERRQRGISLPLLENLKVKFVVVSLPVRSLSGRHDLKEGHRNVLYNLIRGKPWRVTEIEFSNELVFCIDKS